MKIFNEVILGSILVAQTVSANYEDSEMKSAVATLRGSNMHSDDNDDLNITYDEEKLEMAAVNEELKTKFDTLKKEEAIKMKSIIDEKEIKMEAINEMKMIKTNDMMYDSERDETNPVDFHDYHDEAIEKDSPIEFLDDLDKAIEEEDINEEEEDYFELVNADIDSPVKLRGSTPSNMTDAEDMISSRSNYKHYNDGSNPASKNYYKEIVNGKCVEYKDFNVGPIYGQTYFYQQVLNEWSSEKPGLDIVEAGWESTGQWISIHQTSYIKLGRECPGYFKLAAPEPISCPEGSHIKDEDECIEAGKAIGGKLRYNNLVVGVWSHVPYYCSVQTGGDMSIHFNTREGYNDGGYSSVCAQQYN